MVCMVCACGRLEVCMVKQKAAFEMRIKDWSSDVCSSHLFDLGAAVSRAGAVGIAQVEAEAIRDKILTVSRQWPSFMIKRGVKQSELAMIAPALYVERAPRAVQPDSSFDFG